MVAIYHILNTNSKVHVHIQTQIHTNIYTGTHTHTHKGRHTHIHKHARTHARTHAHKQHPQIHTSHVFDSNDVHPMIH